MTNLGDGQTSNGETRNKVRFKKFEAVTRSPLKPQKLRKKKLLEKRITIPDIHFNNAGVHK